MWGGVEGWVSPVVAGEDSPRWHGGDDVAGPFSALSPEQ